MLRFSRNLHLSCKQRVTRGLPGEAAEVNGSSLLLHCCTCLSCRSDGDTLKSGGKKDKLEERNIFIIRIPKLLCSTRSCHGEDKCFLDE
ncbi:hypothetical protein F2P81_017278 [Scophthalmus maximus]|uniref:Uncharacterized protein n=1 Tax=Scophthalmus maximus TaxID=52904 RepID=A0A6A4SBJ8_SCOMX|nr:hypothetical protein F2P81_017278 [Scophthalmus maximus]